MTGTGKTSGKAKARPSVRRAQTALGGTREKNAEVNIDVDEDEDEGSGRIEEPELESDHESWKRGVRSRYVLCFTIGA
jgi:hypothetical protein